MLKSHLPENLKELVFKSVKVLGLVIENQYGTQVFNRVEKLRRSMKSLRGVDDDQSYIILQKELRTLKKLDTKELFQVSHCYSMMLELINRCETAYRSHRLSKTEPVIPQKTPYASIFVFTAHPTEARATNIVNFFGQVERILFNGLDKGFKQIEDDLFHLLSLLLKLPMANNEKPSVKDEAKYIFSFVLKDNILSEQIKLHQSGMTVHFRTWVGGDKDGHTGVNDETMQMCFSLSRKCLIDFIQTRLSTIKETLGLINEKKLLLKLSVLIKSANDLLVLKKGDGKKIVNFNNKLKIFVSEYHESLKSLSPELRDIETLIWLYPALVMQLEVREDSEFVHEALKNKDMTIVKMLKYLKEISLGHDPKWYVRGFVLSMVESDLDLIAGTKLLRKVLGAHLIPIVPLFENELALTNAIPILTNFFKEYSSVLDIHKENWNGRYEVMLGYSDSSKENGVLPSRHLIATALGKLDVFLRKNKLTPVFFHGSGGSIERGGGTIKEQTRWWPKSAIHIFKATCQGEMVARTFGDERIMNAHISKIADQLNSPRLIMKDLVGQESFDLFVNMIMEKYKATWDSPDFFEMVEKATPYSYLDQLKIGSRPTKRSTGGAKRKLRAIPWVLCWTQTRTLFPTWWGVGSSWKNISPKDKYNIMKAYKDSDLLRSFVKVLGFTLAKVELSIFKIYLSESTLSKELQEKFYNEFVEEYNDTLIFFKEVSGKDDLLWFKPWLLESITFRASMIHPLNLIQLLALERRNGKLLRETVTGIACGMLTTG